MNGEIIGKSEAADATAAVFVADCNDVTIIVKKTGATTVAIHESDDGTTFAAADAKYVIDKTGTAAGTYLMSYLGYKPYIKVVLGTAANATVVALKSGLIHQA